MSMLDAILGQVAGHDLSGLAGKVGLSPDQLQTAIGALGQAQPEPGDTAGLAAERTGLPVNVLQQVLGHLGGEGGLSQIAGALGGGGEGEGGLGGLAGGLGGLFGR